MLGGMTGHQPPMVGGCGRISPADWLISAALGAKLNLRCLSSEASRGFVDPSEPASNYFRVETQPSGKLRLWFWFITFSLLWPSQFNPSQLCIVVRADDYIYRRNFAKLLDQHVGRAVWAEPHSVLWRRPAGGGQQVATEPWGTPFPQVTLVHP
jgi:hypothetical protein